MATVKDLTDVLARLTAGDTLKITFLRKSGTAYEEKEVTATLTYRNVLQ